MNTFKILILVLLGGAFLSASTNLVQAVESTGANTRLELRPETREENEEIREEAREEIEENREETRQTIRQQISNKRQEILVNLAYRHAERLQVRFDFYNKRLTNLASKIQARIDQLEEQGNDMSDAQLKLNEATSSLEKAKTLADESITKFKTITSTEDKTQSEIALAARDLANQAREEFAKVLSLLKDAALLVRPSNI